MPCDDCLNRREFLTRSTLAVAGAAAMAAGCGDGQFGPAQVISSVNSVSFKASSVPALATVGQLAHVPSDRFFATVKRTGAASFAAFSSICTHQGCETGIVGNIIVCPCHGSHYDANGKVTQQPQGTSGFATDLPTFTAQYDAATDTLTIST